MLKTGMIRPGSREKEGLSMTFSMGIPYALEKSVRLESDSVEIPLEIVTFALVNGG